MSSRHPDPARSTLRLGFLLAALVFAMSAASSAFGADGRWELAVGTAAAAPQTAVELPVVLTTNGASVSAIAFTVEFDSSKLALDGGPTLGSKVEIAAPTMFTSSSWVGSEAGVIGVVVYDSIRPIGILSDGTIATIRFRILPDATGAAPVRVSTARPFSASGPRGEPLEGDIAPAGGISIVAATGSAAVAAPEIGHREHPIERPRRSEKDLAVVVPLLSGSDAEAQPRWASSLLLHNRGEQTATVRLTLLRDGGLVPAEPLEVSVPPGATRAWDDGAAELFGVPGGTGALLVERPSEALVVATSVGENAQIVADPPGQGELRIIAVGDTARGRSVVAIANVQSEKASFAIEVRDGEGALLDVRRIEVDARSTRELPLRWSALPAGENLTVLIRSDGARYAAWATTRTGDGVPVLRIAR